VLELLEYRQAVGRHRGDPVSQLLRDRGLSPEASAEPSPSREAVRERERDKESPPPESPPEHAVFDVDRFSPDAVDTWRRAQTREGEHAPDEVGAGWEYRHPVSRPSEHHTLPFVLNRTLMFQAPPPIHTSGARYRTRVGHRLAKFGPSEKEARRMLLEREAQHLTPDQREVWLLRTRDGMSYKQIAAELGVTITTVRERLRRAREALRRQLQDR